MISARGVFARSGKKLFSGPHFMYTIFLYCLIESEVQKCTEVRWWWGGGLAVQWGSCGETKWWGQGGEGRAVAVLGGAKFLMAEAQRTVHQPCLTHDDRSVDIHRIRRVLRAPPSEGEVDTVPGGPAEGCTGGGVDR